jgi:alpha-glucosidase
VKAIVMGSTFLLVSLGLPAGDARAQSPYSLRSPDGRISVTVRAADRLRYDVLLNGKPLLQDSSLSMDVDRRRLGVAPKVLAAKERSNDQTIEPPVRQRFAKIRDRYNELRLELEGGYAVVFRAYDHGAAYRFETSLPQAEVKVYGEEAGFRFTGNHTVYYPQEETLLSHNERKFLPVPLAGITPAAIATLPAVVDAGGVKVAIAESDVEDYPGLWLRGAGGNSLAGHFPPYALEEAPVTTNGKTSDRDIAVTKAADYIAATKGTRTFPWRLLAVAAM